MDNNKKTHKYICWHVFADNIDDWFSTLKEAKEAYKELKNEGYESIRIYKEEYDDEGMIDENYHMGIGGFPL